MSDPKTARRGVFAGVAAMLLAVVATWAGPEISRALVDHRAHPPGRVVGVWLSRVPLTAVPQRTALSHAFGGLAAGLVGTAKYFYWFGEEGTPNLTAFRMTAIIAEIILGYLTFTGSLIAAGKLQEIKWIPQRPWLYRGQNWSTCRPCPRCGLGILLILVPDRIWSPAAVRRDHHAGLELRLDAGHADRRGGHAHGDLDPERLRRPVGGGDGLCAGQQAADHGRGTGRLVGLDPVDHHVQGDESLVHQRAVRRLRAGPAGGGRRPNRRRPRARRRRGRPRSWNRPASW